MVAAAHPVLVRGSFGTGHSTAPSLMAFTHDDFVPRLIADLATAEGREQLQANLAKDRTDDGVLRLYQPVHRVFNLALVDVSCLQVGMPRLDPARIVSAGLVLRRLAGRTQQAWMERDGRAVGWHTIAGPLSTGNDEYDPDPVLREQRRLGANAAVLSRAAAVNTLSESSARLFLLPQPVCVAAKKTYMFGVLPLAGGERADLTEEAAVPFSIEDVRARLPGLLQAGGKERHGLPPTDVSLSSAARRFTYAQSMFGLLDYLALEAGVFADEAGTEHVHKALNAISIAWPQPDSSVRTEPLGDYLRRAHDVLLGQPESATGTATVPSSILTPPKWPAVSTAESRAVVAAIHATMTRRWERVAPRPARMAPGAARARYVVLAFVRVQDDPQCPPHTIWSAPTEPFEIVPWYEGSKVPPVQIELPELNRESLKKMTPNVSFKVPPSLQKFMDKMNLDDLMSGGPKKSDGAFGMICSFSIPIITICAFIVLQIFLSLLNIIFWWLPYVRICLPFPKR